MTAPYTGGLLSMPSGLPGGNQSPFSSTPGSTMGTPMNYQQQTAIELAIHNNPDLAGIWDTIKNSGGDVWGTIQGLIDKAGGWENIGKNVYGFIKDNASGILQGLNALNSYQRQGKADEYAKQALDLAKTSYADKAPLRAAGQAGMLDPHKGTPDLSNLSAQGQQGASMMAPLPMAAPQTAYQNAGSIAGNNPFAKGLPMAPAPVGPGTAQGQGTPPPFTPKPPTPTPLPLGPPPAVTPGVGGAPPPTPGTLQLAPQSGPISAGPQSRPLPTFPTGLPQYGLSTTPPGRSVYTNPPPPPVGRSVYAPLPLAGS